MLVKVITMYYQEQSLKIRLIDRIQQYHKDSFQKMLKKFSWKMEICPKQNSVRKHEIGSELVTNVE